MAHTELLTRADAHRPALLRKARRLLGDDHAAEDAVQETMIRAPCAAASAKTSATCAAGCSPS